MIKKLRRRFIIVNMSILMCLLFGVLSGIFAYMYSTEVRISYELMESILNDRDIGIQPPDKVVESADALPETDGLNVSFMSMNGQNGFFNENQNRHENDLQENLRDNPQWNEKPEKPDDMPQHEPFPEKPMHTMPQATEKPNNDVKTEVEAGVTDDADSSETEHEESSQIIPETQTPTTQKPTQKPTEKSSEKPITEEETALPVTEKQSQTNESTTKKTTVKMFSENVQTKVTPPSKPKEPLKEPEPPFADPYKGNVKRAYVMVQYNTENDIDKVFNQYFDDIDEEAVKNAANVIINSDDDKGKLTVGDYRLRFMKKESPRFMSGGGRIVFLDRTLEISTINRMLFIFIIIGSVGVILIFGISILLANWTIKPVEKAWQQQKQFVADASHELKTPLTVISANTDVILSNKSDTVENQSKWLNYIKDETTRMTKLVNSMLYIAKYDSNELKFSLSQFNVSEIAENICLQYESLVFESGKMLETEIAENVLIKGDEDKIKQLINILLDNANKYSTENGKIKLELWRDSKNGKVNIIVSNTSELIPSEKLEKLFDRFYRLDDSRNRKTGGSGLGLNIAKTITDAHGGTIRAEHHNGVTRFIVNI